jgi:hypothetical protein
MTETLEDGWLATELDLIDKEIEAWPEGLKQSLDSLSENSGKPPPRLTPPAAATDPPAGRPKPPAGRR